MLNKRDTSVRYRKVRHTVTTDEATTMESGLLRRHGRHRIVETLSADD